MFKSSSLYFKKILFCLFFIAFGCSMTGAIAQDREFIRLTGGPIFYDELKGKQLNDKKWGLWGIKYSEYDNFSYKVDSKGITLLTVMNCFENPNNYYGIESVSLRGLANISLVAEVDVFYETKYLPVVVHLCNCCSNYFGRDFTNLAGDDFWCEVNLHKDTILDFNHVEIINFEKLDTKHTSISYTPKNYDKKKATTYLVKIVQSIPDYKVSGYIRELESEGKYVHVGSTLHPYPFSQSKVELKTYTKTCDDKEVLKEPSKIVTFRNMRVYKNPEQNPLFIRVINEEGAAATNHKVQLTIDNSSNEVDKLFETTDQDGYVQFDLSKVSQNEYPILNCNIQVYKTGIDAPLFNKNFKLKSLIKGIYPGDFWQLYCKDCN